MTVGEKIGKDDLTYGQRAAAKITAMATIGAADYLGLPVSNDSRPIVGRSWNGVGK